MNKGFHFRWYLICCWMSVASGAVLTVLLIPINAVRGLFGLRKLANSVTNLFSTEKTDVSTDLVVLNKAQYAIKFLFRNSFQYHYVLAFAQSEANNLLGSNIAKLYNNIFGYGFSPRSPYQSSIYDSKAANEPKFAVYKNVFYCVYDFYYMAKNYNTRRWDALQKFPDGIEWAAESPYNIGYINAVTREFKISGYFGADEVKKRNLIYQLQYKHFVGEDFAFKVTNFISVLLAVGVFFISFRWVVPAVRPQKKEVSK